MRQHRAILLLAALVIGFCGCVRTEGKPMDFEHAFYEEETNAVGHITRRYYLCPENGERLCVGESFGYEIDDYIVDLDGDGISELVCNCTFGADGTRRVYVFRIRGGKVERGTLAPDAVILTDFINRGAAAQEFYNAESGDFCLQYSTANGIRKAHFTYGDLRFEAFELK